MALTIRMRVTSVTSSEVDPEAPPLELISEGLRQKADGSGATTTVCLVAGPKDLDTWNAPANLWISLSGGDVAGWEVGSLHDVTITPTPVDGTAE